MVPVVTVAPAPSTAGLGLDQPGSGVRWGVGGLVRGRKGRALLGSPLLFNVKLEKEAHQPGPTSKAA